MQSINEELTQKDLLSIELKKIRPNVSKKDREAYMLAYNKKSSTVSWYLKGVVYDLDTATEMLTFFKKRIEDRSKLITA